MGTYTVHISVSGTNHIVYQRALVFGTDKPLVFDPKQYSEIKRIFDGVHKGDNHMLTLRADDTAQAASGAER